MKCKKHRHRGRGRRRRINMAKLASWAKKANVFLRRTGAISTGLNMAGFNRAGKIARFAGYGRRKRYYRRGRGLMLR